MSKRDKQSMLGLRVAVVGASVGGMSAALALSRVASQVPGVQVSVDLFERSGARVDCSRGSGIGLSPTARTHLEQWGVLSRIPLMTNATMRQTDLGSGKTFGETYMGEQMCATHWGWLWLGMEAVCTAPGQNIKIHHGKGVTKVSASSPEKGASGTFDTVHLSDGSSHSGYDLVVDASGVRSVLRNLIDTDGAPAYAGYVLYRSLVPIANFKPDSAWRKYPAGTDTWTRWFSMGYGRAGNRTAAMHVAYPIPVAPSDPACGGDPTKAVTPDAHAVMHALYVHYKPELRGKAPTAFLEGRDGTTSSFAVAEGNVPLDEQAAYFAGGLPRVEGGADIMLPDFEAETPRSSSTKNDAFIQAVYDYAPAHMAKGNCVLLGDAAHIARPHIGAGTAIAIEDAIQLGVAVEKAIAEHMADGASPSIADAIQAALSEHYDKVRVPLVKKQVDTGRALGYFYMDDPKVDWKEPMTKERFGKLYGAAMANFENVYFYKD